MTDEIRQIVEQAAAALKEAGAREVYIFGSAATGPLREGSDIDLAIEGLPPERFWDAMSRAADVLRRPLDLIDLDEDTPFTRYLKEAGELVRVG